MQEYKVIRLKTGKIVLDENGDVLSFYVGNLCFLSDDIHTDSKEYVIGILQNRIDNLVMEFSDLRKVRDYINDSFNDKDKEAE